MRIMIVCGGTGGHIYPCIAIARKIKQKEYVKDIVFIGRKKSLEEQIFLKEGLRYRTIIISGMPRVFSLKWITFIFKMILGFIQSLLIIKKEKPDIIIGAGAYITVPVMLAGKVFRAPELLLEQNVYPGLAVRILSRVVDIIAISFQETSKYLQEKKCIHTGNPVRPEVFARTREDALKALNLDINKKTILIFGGSLGAHKINMACIEMAGWLESIQDIIQLIVITGDKDFKNVSECYGKTNIKTVIAPFIFNMEDALACASIAVSRAGASTIAELTIKGIPAILIPYPYATGDHQLKNAQCLVKEGAAYIIPDKDLEGEILKNTLNEILFNDDKLESMCKASKKLGSPDAVDKILKIIEKMGNLKC